MSGYDAWHRAGASLSQVELDGDHSGDRDRLLLPGIRPGFARVAAGWTVR
jgi:hypothetical protein